MVAQLTEYSKLLHHSSPSKLCEWRYMTCTIPRKRAPEEADMPTSNYWPSAPTAVVAQLTEFSNLLSHRSPSCARGGTLVLLAAWQQATAHAKRPRAATTPGSVPGHDPLRLSCDSGISAFDGGGALVMSLDS